MFFLSSDHAGKSIHVALSIHGSVDGKDYEKQFPGGGGVGGH